MSETTIIDGTVYAMRSATNGCLGCSFFAPAEDIISSEEVRRRRRLCGIAPLCVGHAGLGSVIFVSGIERELHEDEGG